MTQLRIHGKPVAIPTSVDFAVTPGCAYAVVKIDIDGDARLIEVETPAGQDQFNLNFIEGPEGLDIRGPGGRHLFHVPGDAHLCPTVPTKQTQLGLALLLDSTMMIKRTPDGAGTHTEHYYDSDQWQRLKAELADCYGQLQTGMRDAKDTRTAILQFGDDSDENYTPAVMPEHPFWQNFNAAEVQRQLGEAQPMDGGDAIDALAAGIAACDALIRPQQTNIVLIVGNSLGYMVVDRTSSNDREQIRFDQALLHRANAKVRGTDVFCAADTLKEAGFIIATIFEDDQAKECFPTTPDREALLAKARLQYQQLASVPSLSFLASNFNATAFAEAFAALPEQLGTHYAWASPINLPEPAIPA